MQWLRNNLLIVLILFVAAIIRLYHIDGYMTFLGDEGRDAIAIYNIILGIGSLLHGNIHLAEKQLTLLGPTASVGGFFMGPAYYYIVAPFFFLFGYTPVGASVMVTLLGVISVWLVYKIGTEFFNKKAGLIAALLYTFSPLVIIYSRSSWNPNVMPFFTLVTLYSLYKAVKHKNIWLFLLCGVLFGIDIQLHYVELFVGVVIILYVIFMYAKTMAKKPQKLLIQIIRDGCGILGGFLIGFSPFIAFEYRHEFLNTKNIFNFIFASGETGASSNFFVNVWNVFVRLFARLLTDFPLPNDFPKYNGTVLSIWYIFSVVIAISCFAYLVYVYKKHFHDSKKFLQYSLLLLWLAIGIAFFGLYKKNIYDYYFAFLYPVPFLAFGGLLSEVYDNTVLQTKQNTLIYVKRVFIVCLLFLIMGIFIAFSPLKDAVNNQLYSTKQISDFVLDKTDGKPFNFALITGGNSDHAYRYFFLRAGREPIVIENSMNDPKRTTVTDQLLVICDSLPCSPLGDSLWEIAGFGRAEIVGHWKVAYVEVYKLKHYSGK